MTPVEPLPIFAPEVLAMPVEDCSDGLADVRQIPGIVMARHYAEDPACGHIVRSRVWRMLAQAQRLLPDGRRLLFAEGLRRLQVQRQLMARVRQELALANPAWTPLQVEAEAALYVAPSDGSPPHSTGGAVDVSLADADGTELALGSPLNGAQPAAHTRFVPHDAEAAGHRALLVDVMTRAGFVNYDAEWWHWSYGDPYWAVRTGSRFAIYGAVERHPLLARRLEAIRQAAA